MLAVEAQSHILFSYLTEDRCTFLLTWIILWYADLKFNKLPGHQKQKGQFGDYFNGTIKA